MQARLCMLTEVCSCALPRSSDAGHIGLLSAGVLKAWQLQGYLRAN